MKQICHFKQEHCLALMLYCLLSSGCQGQQRNISTSSGRAAAGEQIPPHPVSNEQYLDLLLQKIGDERVVMHGMATHGTAEIYTWRTAITKRLIQEKGFYFIAVKGAELPDLYPSGSWKGFPGSMDAGCWHLIS